MRNDVIILGEFGKKGGELGLKFGDAFRVGLLDWGRDIHLLDSCEDLLVDGIRVDDERAAFGRSPDGAVFARRPGDVLGVSNHD